MSEDFDMAAAARGLRNTVFAFSYTMALPGEPKRYVFQHTSVQGLARARDVISEAERILSRGFIQVKMVGYPGQRYGEDRLIHELRGLIVGEPAEGPASIRYWVRAGDWPCLRDVALSRGLWLWGTPGRSAEYPEGPHDGDRQEG